jgi:hypothetical protein
MKVTHNIREKTDQKMSFRVKLLIKKKIQMTSYGYNQEDQDTIACQVVPSMRVKHHESFQS